MTGSAAGKRGRRPGTRPEVLLHDFNNLLTVILGAADTVLDRPGIDPQTAADARQIRVAAEHGAALVRRLLPDRAAPMAAPGVTPHRISVNTAMSSLAAVMRQPAGRGCTVSLTLAEPDLLVPADPVDLGRALLNLAMNARLAMPAGGTLTLHGCRRTLTWAEAHDGIMIPAADYAVIEVADTGAGIPVDVLPRIFEPAFTTRRRRGGTGLGLAQVRAMLDDCGGFATVDSQPGRGTKIRLWLPAPASAPVPIPAPASAPAGVSPNPPAARTVLLVEDDPTLRRLTIDRFEGAGWRVLAAASAEAALAALPRSRKAERPLDLVITDAALPGQDGAALIAAIRKIMPDIPAILVSGYAESAIQGNFAGMRVVFLPKPYRIRELLATAASLVGDRV
jgi:two-component system, cell cycle sensor histidine kinase and response regulator CckA